MLQVKNLGMVYPDGTRALEDLSFSVEQGEFLVVIGLSGSGKSTLLRCINRLLDPAEGEILLAGKNIAAINNKARKVEESRKIREKTGMLREEAIKKQKLAKTGEERRQYRIKFKEELRKLKLEDKAVAAKTREKKDLEKARRKEEDLEFGKTARTRAENKAYKAKRKEEKAQQKDLRKIRRKIGMIFQHFNLVKRSNVMTNVLSGRLGYVPVISSIFHRFPEADRKKAKEALEMVGLTEQARKRADELSGGQQQRVGIARALMQDPAIILADEPVASLDPVLAHTILGYLEKLNKEKGITVICSLHYLDLVQRYATRVIGLKSGKLVYEGTGKDIKNMTDAEFKEIYGEDAQRINASLTGDIE